VRVVRLGDGSLVPGRSLPGRGAWLCRGSTVCLGLARKRQAFGRAFRAPVSAAAVDGLEQELGFPTGDPERSVPESPVL
jgi:predicted RNA-binding protein YlxR (DUF448 family)